MTTVSRHYVLAAGGTGGHLIPAFALAVELEKRGHHVALITDERGAKIPGKPDFMPAHILPPGRIAGKNPLNWIKGALGVLEGRRMALRLFEGFQPSAVIGFGGYPSVPTLMAATSAKVSTVLHEQNAVLGRVNRRFAAKANALATSSAQVDRLDPKLADKVTLVGNPVREEVMALRARPFPAFTEDSLFRILVTGGSQGARVLSEVVPDGLAMLPTALRSRLQVIQQCRPEDIDAVRQRYASHGIPAELATYFEDMAERLADAHLFIGRSGASTIAELTAVGRPAIVVPLPIATDDHQAANAREIVAAGGARSIRQDKFTASELAKQILAMAQHPETLGNAAHAAWNCGYPNAASDLADIVESFGATPIQDVIRMTPKPATPLSGEALAKEFGE